jgi:hypothetical protein
MSSQEKAKLSIASAIELSIEFANEATSTGKVKLCTTDIDRLIASLGWLTVLLPAAAAALLGQLHLSDLSRHGLEERSSERPLH